MDDAMKLREMKNNFQEPQTTQKMNLPPSKIKFPTETVNTTVTASAARCYGGGSGGRDTKLRSSNPKQHAAGARSSTLIGYVIRNNSSAQRTDQNNLSSHKLHEKFQNEQKSRSKKPEVQEEKTNDKATQTDEEYHQTPLEKMDAIINVLCAKLDRLKTQTQILDLQVANKRQQNCSLSDSIENNKLSHSRTSYVPSNTLPSGGSDEDSEYETSENENDSEKQSVSGCCNGNVKPSPMVPIGNGNAVVPLSVLSAIDWSSYTKATNTLMSAVFSRKILATSSLTGRPPAYCHGKPGKKQLNPALVKDIIKTVVERCKVPENAVKPVVTRKCSNESMSFRNLYEKKRPLSAKKNARLHSTSSVESTSTSLPRRRASSYFSSNSISSEPSDDDFEYKKSEGDRNKEENTTTGLLCKATDTPPTMVPIGKGNTAVPSSVLRMIDWSSHASATRSLMLAVFSRKVLATSCLRGRTQSDPLKPPKKQLNPAVVDDIVQTVVDRCNVKESIVRRTMSIICSGESKMFRSRHLNKKRTPLKKNSSSRSLGSAKSSDNTQN